MKKRSINSRNTSGYLGVTWSKQKQKWRARIRIEGKDMNLGFYDDPEEAGKAYQEVYEKLVVPNLEDTYDNRIEYIKKWQEENREKVKQYKKKYKQENIRKTREYEKKVKLKLKIEIIQEYGGECKCCGEKEPRFLTIDHIRGDGSAHRKEINRTTGYRFYLWLKENGFPKENFQLLCFNCNIAKGANGVCPHQERKNED